METVNCKKVKHKNFQMGRDGTKWRETTLAKLHFAKFAKTHFVQSLVWRMLTSIVAHFCFNKQMIFNIFTWPMHRQLVVSIPRLLTPCCPLLGKINAMWTFSSMRQLYLQWNGQPLWKSQKSCREKCSHYFDQWMAGWYWESRYKDH